MFRCCSACFLQSQLWDSSKTTGFLVPSSCPLPGRVSAARSQQGCLRHSPGALSVDAAQSHVTFAGSSQRCGRKPRKRLLAVRDRGGGCGHWGSASEWGKLVPAPGQRRERARVCQCPEGIASLPPHWGGPGSGLEPQSNPRLPIGEKSQRTRFCCRGFTAQETEAVVTVAKAAVQGLCSLLSWSFGSSAAGGSPGAPPEKGCGDAAPGPPEAETTAQRQIQSQAPRVPP